MHIGVFDAPAARSQYYAALGGGRALVGAGYKHEHAVLTRELANITGNQTLKDYAARWERYEFPLVTSLLSHPRKLTRRRTATFLFSSSLAGSNFQCRVDEDSFTACTSPKLVRSLSHSIHTFYVRAGMYGAVDATPVKWTWRVDLKPPNTTISKAPPARLASSTARFRFSSSEPNSTFHCRLDDKRFRTSCSAQKTYRGLAPGWHILRVRAKDRAGNLDPMPARYMWRVGG